MIRVAVADDQALIRNAVAQIIGSEPDIEVVGHADTGLAAHRLAIQARPDVVLMDIRMPVMDGIEATDLICRDPALAETRVLILTTFEEDEYVVAALRAGASGFVGKGAEPDELVRAIRAVDAGEALLSPAATRGLIDRYLRTDPSAVRPGPKIHAPELTARENEILLLVARGGSNDDIAKALFISPHTAKTHVKRIMAKIGAHDRAQVVIYAYENGLISSQQG
ncbi:DNA-binding response regulator [Agromyces luteolus]|uniref:Response regulator n=1 Tax=Agromyces luteolus TaxID=88373 RepID=A0A7C9M0R1_9MICO|nr:response regulator transcription factor [Agromyces luteolus]MUN08573.1 response regulator [Agromyces luteolus]GLK27109.1 DNA-binding response regulator [Agromyces luteolus]